MPPTPTVDETVRQGRSRLYPSLRNPNWLVLRQRRAIFESGIGRLPEKNICVLDVGGRLQPYRELLGARIGRYVAVDLEFTPLVSAVASGEALPFRDEQFDLVICTQVLEYFAEPQRAARELWRVLRKDGFAFVSAPAIFLRDHENEYWRFLPRALRFLLRDFETVEVTAEGNSLVGLLRTLNVFVVSFARPRALVPVLQWTIVPCLNSLGFLLEGFGTNDAFAANFSVWARK